MKFLRPLWSALLDTLFPPRCAFCKKEGAFLCVSCIKQFSISHLPVRRSGAGGQFSKRKPKNAEKEFRYLDGVIYALDYAKNPVIQAALHQFKYRFTESLSDHFGDLLAEKLKELSMFRQRPAILVPVPLHKKRLNERGFNQAELIAQAVADRLPDRIEIILFLERIRYTSQQAKLDRKGRQENLKGAFEFIHNARVRGPFIKGEKRKKGKKEINKEKMEERKKDSIFFLVDDVFTTGATLENCAKVLKENGVKKVYGLVVARAFK